MVFPPTRAAHEALINEVKFLKEENKKLFPKIIIIERNDNLWDSDLIKILNNFNFRVHKKTKMNYILINN